MQLELQTFLEAKKQEYDMEILPNFIPHIGEKSLKCDQFKCVKEFIFVEKKVAERKIKTQTWNNSINDMRNFCFNHIIDCDESIFDIFNTIAGELRDHTAIKTVELAKTKLNQFAFDLNAVFFTRSR